MFINSINYRLRLASAFVCICSLAALPVSASVQDAALPKNADSTNNLLADEKDSVTNATTSNASSTGTSPSSVEPDNTSPPSPSKMSRFGKILKSNIVETFQLDPRLQKDLTEGNPDLRPIKLLQDNFSIGYNPSINWDRTAGPPWVTSYSTRAMSLYAVGPITKHLSAWIQMLPQSNLPGFFQHFELFQGMANYGNDKNFFQIRGGQGFNWQNVGFGGADRTITLTTPGVYTAFNGFDPTAPEKNISLEATGLNWTTGKIFGYWQQSTNTTNDSTIMYHNRGYGMGLSVEKLLGKTGISGIQSNLTFGNTPVFNGAPNATGVNPIGTQTSPYVWWTSWINRSIQDKKGYVRLNPSFGLTVFNVKRYLDDSSVAQNRSTGYGYTFDLVAIPVLSYWTTILRFDNFRSNDIVNHNTTYTFTVGQALDMHLPNKGRLRVTFDYQYIGQRGTFPSNRIILGFWPIW